MDSIISFKREKYEAKNKYSIILKSISTLENKEHESYYKQRMGNVSIQYFVPSHLRDVVLKKTYDSVYGGRQGRDKVEAR